MSQGCPHRKLRIIEGHIIQTCVKPRRVSTHRLQENLCTSIHSPQKYQIGAGGHHEAISHRKESAQNGSACSLFWIQGIITLTIHLNVSFQYPRPCPHRRWGLQWSLWGHGLSARGKSGTNTWLCTKGCTTESVTVQIQFSFFVNESVWNLWLHHFKCKIILFQLPLYIS